jgi:uncharacterized membrane protein YjdF
VYFDPADPETNALTDFSVLSRNEFGPVPLVSLGIIALFVAVFMLRRRARIRDRALTG